MKPTKVLTTVVSPILLQNIKYFHKFYFFYFFLFGSFLSVFLAIIITLHIFILHITICFLVFTYISDILFDFKASTYRVPTRAHLKRTNKCYS